MNFEDRAESLGKKEGDGKKELKKKKKELGEVVSLLLFCFVLTWEKGVYMKIRYEKPVYKIVPL